MNPSNRAISQTETGGKIRYKFDGLPAVCAYIFLRQFSDIMKVPKIANPPPPSRKTSTFYE